MKADIKNLRRLLNEAYPTPWVADVDDPHHSDGGFWTGKFYTGTEANGNAGTWVTYNDDKPCDMPSVRLVEAAISALPELLDRLELAESELEKLRADVRTPTFDHHQNCAMHTALRVCDRRCEPVEKKS